MITVFRNRKIQDFIRPNPFFIKLSTLFKFGDFLALRRQQYLNVSVWACRASSAGVAAGTASRCAVGGAVALHAQVKKDEGDSIPGRRREVGVIRHLGIPQRIIGIAL